MDTTGTFSAGLLAAVPFSGPLAKVLFLSMILSLIIIPTRRSRAGLAHGPKSAVFSYLLACVGYYFLLRFVLPKLG